MNNRKALLDTVAQKHSHIFEEKNGRYPGNTHENCAALLYDFCVAAAEQYPLERWGLLTKDDGENGYTYPSGKRVSIDVMAIPNGERVDAIGAAADMTTKPSTSWNEIPEHEWRPNNVWIKHTDVLEGEPEEPSVTFPPYEAMGGDAAGVELATVLFNDYQTNNVPMNPGVGTWFWRTMYDAFYQTIVNGADPETALRESTKKHRNEWVEILGGKYAQPK